MAKESSSQRKAQWGNLMTPPRERKRELNPFRNFDESVFTTYLVSVKGIYQGPDIGLAMDCEGSYVRNSVLGKCIMGFTMIDSNVFTLWILDSLCGKLVSECPTHIRFCSS